MSGNIETGFKLTFNGKEVEFGLRSTTEQLRALTLEATKAGAASSAAAKDYTEKLAQQAAKLGMTATQARVYEAAIRGATKADQEAVRVLSDKIEAHQKAERSIQGVAFAAKAAGAVIATAYVAMLRESVFAAREAEQQMLKLDAVFKGSGGASGLQRYQLESMAEGMKDRTGFDDDKLRGAMALLLTFRSIGRESFGAVMESAADLSRLMGQDLNSSVLMLGKALENPEHGLTALSRAGVSFSEAQKQNIKDMVASGQQAEAMTAILQTLRDQGINGVAEAMNTGLFKATNNASMAWDDFLKAIGKSSVVKGPVESFLTELALRLNNIKAVVENGDWMDRLAVGFSFGQSTGKVDPSNEWEGSVGGTEARKAREAQAKKNAESLAEQRDVVLRRFESREQQKARELANVRRLFEGSPDLDRAVAGVEEKYAVKGKASHFDPEADFDAKFAKMNEKAKRDNFDAIDKRAEKEAAELEKLRKQYVAMADPLQKYRDQLAEIERLKELGPEKGGLSGDQAFEAMARVNEEMDKTWENMNKVKETGKDAFETLTRAVEGWGNAFTDQLADMVMKSKANFGDLANSIVRDLLRMQIKESITTPLFDWGKSILKDVFKNADGGVYQSAGLHAYANTIVSSPTLFRFAQGGAFGLMGEAGPEAIMPLKRGPGGRLGVQATGGGGVTVNIIGAPSAPEVQQRRDSNGALTLDVIFDRVDKFIAGNIASGRGLTPNALESTYGMNRAHGGF